MSTADRRRPVSNLQQGITVWLTVRDATKADAPGFLKFLL